MVYGAGGHAKIILTILEEGGYEIAGLVDDAPAKQGTCHYGYRILGGEEQLARLRAAGVDQGHAAIGDNARRAQAAAQLTRHGIQLVTVLHSTATLLRGCQIGPGSAVLVNAFVGAEVTVGEACVVGVGAVVGHDCTVGAYAHLCPGVTLTGSVCIGEYAFLGAGATVLPGVTVGKNTIVGANAVVNRDLPDNVTAVGVPARILGSG